MHTLTTDYLRPTPPLSGCSSISVGRQFELQAIVNMGTGELFAREILHRGSYPDSWMEVDSVLLTEISTPCPTFGRLFVNISNETLLLFPDQVFLRIAQRNDVVFELNEDVPGGGGFSLLAEKVNRLTAQGIHFAIDDFGAGDDGFKRLCVLDHVEYVKIDRGLMVTALARPSAASIIRELIQQLHNRKVKTIAEGIESYELFKLTQDLRVDFGQGFYIDQLSNNGPVGMQICAVPSLAATNLLET